KITPQHLAAGPAQAVESAAFGGDKDVLVKHPRLPDDRSAGHKAPQNLSRFHVQDVDSEILRGDIGEIPMLAQRSGDAGIRLKGVELLQGSSLRQREELTICSRLQDAPRKNQRLLL